MRPGESSGKEGSVKAVKARPAESGKLVELSPTMAAALKDRQSKGLACKLHRTAAQIRQARVGLPLENGPSRAQRVQTEARKVGLLSLLATAAWTV